MYTTTIQQALEKPEDIKATVGKHPEWTKHTLYIIRDEETMLYVGKSIHPLDRLQEHMGRSLREPLPSPIGNLILANAPQSYQWSYDLLRPAEYVGYLCLHNKQPDEIVQMRQNEKEDTAAAEEELIWHLGPCMNGVGNRNRQDLPDHYNNPENRIANEGIKQTSLVIE